MTVPDNRKLSAELSAVDRCTSGERADSTHPDCASHSFSSSLHVNPVQLQSTGGGGGNKISTLRADSKISTLRAGNKTSTLRAGNKTSTLRAGNKTSTLRAGNKTSTLRAGNKTSTLRASGEDYDLPAVDGCTSSETGDSTHPGGVSQSCSFSRQSRPYS